MNILQKIAKAGATVIVTIHQPSPPVVRKIDKVLLLLSGRVLYDGPITCNVEEFFEQKGFPKPNDYNIADWVLVSFIHNVMLFSCAYYIVPFINTV